MRKGIILLIINFFNRSLTIVSDQCCQEHTRQRDAGEKKTGMVLLPSYLRFSEKDQSITQVTIEQNKWTKP